MKKALALAALFLSAVGVLAVGCWSTSMPGQSWRGPAPQADARHASSKASCGRRRVVVRAHDDELARRRAARHRGQEVRRGHAAVRGLEDVVTDLAGG